MSSLARARRMDSDEGISVTLLRSPTSGAVFLSGYLKMFLVEKEGILVKVFLVPSFLSGLTVQLHTLPHGHDLHLHDDARSEVEIWRDLVTSHTGCTKLGDNLFHF